MLDANRASIRGYGPRAFAFVSEWHKDTNDPHIKVHWWTEPCTSLQYSPRVVIKGPKGIPYR